MPRGATAAAMPEMSPPPPTGTTTTSTSGASSSTSSPTVPWPAITRGSSKGWTSTRPVSARCSSSFAKASAGSSALMSITAPSARARSSLNRLPPGHEKTAQSMPSAAAPQASAMAWLPADAPATPRARSSASSAESRLITPRALNDPVCWSSSALSRSPGARSDASSSGVRRTRPRIVSAARRTSSRVAGPLTSAILEARCVEQPRPGGECAREHAGRRAAAPSSRPARRPRRARSPTADRALPARARDPAPRVALALRARPRS